MSLFNIEEGINSEILIGKNIKNIYHVKHVEGSQAEIYSISKTYEECNITERNIKHYVYLKKWGINKIKFLTDFDIELGKKDLDFKNLLLTYDEASVEVFWYPRLFTHHSNCTIKNLNVDLRSWLITGFGQVTFEDCNINVGYINLNSKNTPIFKNCKTNIGEVDVCFITRQQSNIFNSMNIKKILDYFGYERFITEKTPEIKIHGVLNKKLLMERDYSLFHRTHPQFNEIKADADGDWKLTMKEQKIVI